MEFKYTKYQVPRGTRPDFEAQGKLYLIKNVSILYATYQVRLLAYLAKKQNKVLIIRIPEEGKCGSNLKELIKDNKKIIKLERM